MQSTTSPRAIGAWSTDEIFREAQRLVRWHYQWIIVHEFLPQIIGQSLVNNILQRPAHLSARRSASCRSSSRARAIAWATAWCVRRIARTCAGDNGGPFFALHLRSFAGRRARSRPTCAAACERRDASSAGRRSSTSATATCSRTSGIDTTLSTPLFQLPRSDDRRRRRTHLARRSAISCGTSRGRCPRDRRSRVRCARQCSRAAISRISARSVPTWAARRRCGSTSCREAHVMAQGNTLGPVGGRIVGEVLIGLLQLNRNSYLRAQPALASDVPRSLRPADRTTSRWSTC